jgi:N-acetylglucosaminyldiphosphoundecaprenol N-acetyl-beta-D-mannosaminyltransferase
MGSFGGLLLNKKTKPESFPSLNHMPSDHLPGAVRLFGLDILPLNFEQSTDLLLHVAATQGPKVVVTTNVDHVVRLERDPELKALYASADYTFADGMPVVWASRLLGTPLPERVTGADLFVALCRHSVSSGQRVFVLGGRPGQERLLRDRYAKRFPGMDVVVCCPPMNFDPEGPEAEAIVKTIRACQPDFIFVCLGFEKQERWALRHVRRFDSGVIVCVGAAQEFALGLKRRAPRWMQDSGLEWLWRLTSDPVHLWRRYLLQAPVFLWLLLQEWRTHRRSYA